METIYMERGTPLPRYFPLPQFLLDVDISSTSKILFALLLNRANLSQKNVWEDNDGHVYCVYTIEDMAKDMNKGVTAINELTKELTQRRIAGTCTSRFWAGESSVYKDSNRCRYSQ